MFRRALSAIIFGLVVTLAYSAERLPDGWLDDSTFDTQDASRRESWIELVSWTPRAYVYHNFLSPEECEHLIALGEPFVVRSTVVDHATGGSKLNNIRTSSGMFLPRAFDDTIAGIEERIANWTMIPVEHGESMQILKYENGQRYGDHWDFFNATVPSLLKEGQRIVTVLMYLSDVEEGGETCFHKGTYLNEEKQRPADLSPCASTGVCVKPKQGNALMFHDLEVGYQKPDTYSLHTGCPVIKGTKWSATKWIHQVPFRPDELKHKRRLNAMEVQKLAKCEDLDERCGRWKEAGECERNPVFMVGSGALEAPGKCRLSCGACRVCAEGDVLCMRKNGQV